MSNIPTMEILANQVEDARHSDNKDLKDYAQSLIDHGDLVEEVDAPEASNEGTTIIPKDDLELVDLVPATGAIQRISSMAISQQFAEGIPPAGTASFN